MVINADQLRIIISIKEKHILIAIYLEDTGLGTIMKNKSYDSLIRQAPFILISSYTSFSFQ